MIASYAVKGSGSVEILVLVLALLALDVASQLHGADSRPPEPERARR